MPTLPSNTHVHEARCECLCPSGSARTDAVFVAVQEGLEILGEVLASISPIHIGGKGLECALEAVVDEVRDGRHARQGRYHDR
jgi:hypothetical protein